MRLFSVSRERRARRTEFVALLLLLLVSAEIGYLIFLLIN
jgi:hypothetical protein